MPKFLDYHATMPSLPPEAVQQMTAQIQAGQADPFGVTPLNVFAGDGGQGFCLVEAPDAASVLRAHEAMGVPLKAEDVVQVTSLV